MSLTWIAGYKQNKREVRIIDLPSGYLRNIVKWFDSQMAKGVVFNRLWLLKKAEAEGELKRREMQALLLSREQQMDRLKKMREAMEADKQYNLNLSEGRTYGY